MSREIHNLSPNFVPEFLSGRLALLIGTVNVLVELMRQFFRKHIMSKYVKSLLKGFYCSYFLGIAFPNILISAGCFIVLILLVIKHEPAKIILWPFCIGGLIRCILLGIIIVLCITGIIEHNTVICMLTITIGSEIGYYLHP